MAVSMNWELGPVAILPVPVKCPGSLYPGGELKRSLKGSYEGLLSRALGLI